MAEKFASRDTTWKQIKPELTQMVKEEAERQQQRRREGLKKGQEEDKRPWRKDWLTARNSLTTQEVEFVEKARTGGVAVEMETGRWLHVRHDRRRCDHCNARKGTIEHAADRCRRKRGSEVEATRARIGRHVALGGGRKRRRGFLAEWNLGEKAGGVASAEQILQARRQEEKRKVQRETSRGAAGGKRADRRARRPEENHRRNQASHGKRTARRAKEPDGSRRRLSESHQQRRSVWRRYRDEGAGTRRGCS